MMRFYALAVFSLVALAMIPAYAAAPYFQVATDDVASAVAGALAERGAAQKVRASVFTEQRSLYQANHPLKVALQALSFDADSKRWQANMHVLADGKTISVMPIQGRYEALRRVPVLARRIDREDVVMAEDVRWKEVAERQLRKDTVLSAAELIGKAPRNSVSADRPVRASELNFPALVKKNQQVSVTYTAGGISIRSIGKALENGSSGTLVRIQNLDTRHAFTARVTGESQVEANLQNTLTN